MSRLIPLILLLFPVRALSSAQTPQTILASDHVPGDDFGFSVAFQETVGIVGSPKHPFEITGPGPGAAYVFRYGGNEWKEESKIVAGDLNRGFYFGWAVAIDKDVAVVGSPSATGVFGTWGAGAVYVYREDGGIWTEAMKIYAPDGWRDQGFGMTVSIGGNTVAVGAGADVYVFRIGVNTWSLEQKIFLRNRRGGFSVSISGDVIVAGSPYEDADGVSSGAAHVYRFDGSSWVEEQFLFAQNREPGDNFGYDVTIRDNLIVVGARLRDNRFGPYNYWGANSGAAYVFRFVGSAWLEEQMLTASDKATDDFFGTSVSAFGDRIIVGSNREDEANGADTGSAYVYRYDGRTYVEEKKLSYVDAGPGDQFGYSVALAGSRAVVGGHSADLVFTLDLESPGPTSTVSLENKIPSALMVKPAYPNPFASQVTIGFELPRGTHVEVDVFDVLGRILNGSMARTYGPGSHVFSWSPGNVPNGVIFFRVRDENQTRIVSGILQR